MGSKALLSSGGGSERFIYVYEREGRGGGGPVARMHE
jgi:hypothetical protein